MSTTVLLTGASGFIALHIVDVLLSKGYNVIGTVRSQDKADTIIKQFQREYPKGQLSFELVADIGAKGAFDDVLKKHPEITQVLHTASPFAFGLNKPLKEAYWIPATQGTKNVLEAIVSFAPQVKNVVVTSSYAAIVNRDKAGDSSFVHTEETWNPVTWEDVEEEGKAYTASKKLAEKLARDFVDEKKPNFVVTTVNPPFVLGPQKFDDSLKNPTLNTSAELVNKLLKVPADSVEFQEAPTGLSVDVRDVALLHVLPLENDKLSGLRLLPVSAAFNGQILLNIIHKQFPELDGKVGKGDPEVDAEERVKLTQTFYDTSKTKEATGIKEWISLEKTIKDSVEQILTYKKAHE